MLVLCWSCAIPNSFFILRDDRIYTLLVTPWPFVPISEEIRTNFGLILDNTKGQYLITSHPQPWVVLFFLYGIFGIFEIFF